MNTPKTSNSNRSLKDQLLEIDSLDIAQIKSTIVKAKQDGLDVNFIDLDEKCIIEEVTALHYLVSIGNVEAIQSLVNVFKDSIDINIQDSHTPEGYSPLHLAIEFNFFEIIKFFVSEPKINLRLKTRNGNTIIHLAAKYSIKAVLSYLMDSTKIPNEEDSTLDMENIEIPKKKEYIFPLNTVNNESNTVFSLTLTRKCVDVDMIDYLLQDIFIEDLNLRIKNQQGLNIIFSALPYFYLNIDDLIKILKILFDKAKYLFDDIDLNGNNLLHHAIQVKQIYAIPLLLEMKNELAKAKNNAGLTPLLLAINLNHSLKIIEDIFHYDDNCYNIDYFNGNNILHYIASKNIPIDIISFLVKNCHDINVKNADGFTAVALAAKYNNISLCHILIPHSKCDCNFIYANTQSTLLHYAIMFCSESAISTLFAKSLIVMHKNKFGVNSFELYSTESIRRLRELLSQQNRFDSSTFMKKLLDFDYKHKQVIISLKNNVNYNIEEMINNYSGSQLIYAIEHLSLESIKILLKEDGMINRQNKYGDTALHVIMFEKYRPNLHEQQFSSRENNLKSLYNQIIDMLIHHEQIDIKLKNNSGKTVFDLAVEYNDYETLSLLTSIFPNSYYNISNTDSIDELNRQKQRYIKTFYLAIKNNLLCVVEYFIQNKLIDINMVDNQNNTPLLYAIWNAPSDIIAKYLLTLNEIDVNVVNIYGQTVMHFIAYKGYIDLIDILLRLNCTIAFDAKDFKGNTPIGWIRPIITINKNNEEFIVQDNTRIIDVFKKYIALYNKNNEDIANGSCNNLIP